MTGRRWRRGAGARAAGVWRPAPGTAARRRRHAAEARRAGGECGLTAVDIAMMERALRLARRAAALGEVPIGAVVYQGRTVVAEAFNLRETSNDPVGHAELIALREAGRRLGRWRLSGCTLAVTLEPCAMCAGALVNARVDRLVYGAADPKAGACESLFDIPRDRRLNHRLRVCSGVCAEACARLLSDFFKARRRPGRAAQPFGAPTPTVVERADERDAR